MSEKLKPFKIVSTTFLGESNGNYSYEIVFNQSIVHTGRFDGIEKGLDKYREDEMKDTKNLSLKKQKK